MVRKRGPLFPFAPIFRRLWSDPLAGRGEMTNPPVDERYKHAFRDIVYELVDHARHDDACLDHGYRTAMLYVLDLIKQQARAFELDERYLCLADFEPETWYLKS